MSRQWQDSVGMMPYVILRPSVMLFTYPRGYLNIQCQTHSVIDLFAEMLVSEPYSWFFKPSLWEQWYSRIEVFFSRNFVCICVLFDVIVTPRLTGVSDLLEQSLSVHSAHRKMGPCTLCRLILALMLT